MSTVAVVGTVVDDRIVGADGERTRSLGGIAYSVAAMAALAGPEVRIRPVCRVGDDLHARLEQQWRRMRVVALDGIVPFAGPNTTVELDYRRRPGVADRTERLLHLMPPLQSSEVAVAQQADAVLVNCITGFDLDIEALEVLAGAATRIHLDFHSLALGLAPDGRRVPRPPEAPLRWTRTAEVLQCNETELGTIAESLQVGAAEAVLAILESGCRAVVVTRGARGVTLHRRGQSGGLSIDAEPIRAVDPTGAGDTFGAAMTLARLRGQGLVEAARFATRVATATCRSSGVDALRELSGIV